MNVIHAWTLFALSVTLTNSRKGALTWWSVHRYNTLRCSSHAGRGCARSIEGYVGWRKNNHRASWRISISSDVLPGRVCQDPFGKWLWVVSCVRSYRRNSQRPGGAPTISVRNGRTMAHTVMLRKGRRKSSALWCRVTVRRTHLPPSSTHESMKEKKNLWVRK